MNTRNIMEIVFPISSNIIKSINVFFIIQDQVYRFFEDYIKSLQTVFTNSIIYMFNTHDEVQNIISTKDGLFFIFQYPPIEPVEKNIFLINTEQLTDGHYINNIINQFNQGRFTHLIDYSFGNINLVKNTNIPAYWFPYQYNINEIKDYEKTENCIFIGWLDSERRKYILNQIENITILSDQFGDERDNILFRHKILVNIHFSKDYNIHEQLRTTRCIFNKMIVITEPSLDDDINPLKDFMIITEYENIPNMINQVLNNYDEYYNKLFSKSFDEAITELKDKIILQPTE